MLQAAAQLTIARAVLLCVACEQIRPGAIQLHDSEAALIVHYEVCALLLLACCQLPGVCVAAQASAAHFLPLHAVKLPSQIVLLHTAACTCHPVGQAQVLGDLQPYISILQQPFSRATSNRVGCSSPAGQARCQHCSADVQRCVDLVLPHAGAGGIHAAGWLTGAPQQQPGHEEVSRQQQQLLRTKSATVLPAAASTLDTRQLQRGPPAPSAYGMHVLQKQKQKQQKQPCRPSPLHAIQAWHATVRVCCRITVRSLSERTDLQALAAEIVDKCKLIHPSKVRGVKLLQQL